MPRRDKKLIVVGLPGLGYSALQASIDEGNLPNVAALIAAGNIRKLSCPLPPSSIATWGSIATGRFPEDHGQVYDQELWAGGSRTATRASWRCKPIWEELSDLGFDTGSLCWPSTRPGRSWSGCHIDDRLVEPSGIAWTDWPLPLDISPQWLRPLLRECRVHPSDIDLGTVKPLLASTQADGTILNQRGLPHALTLISKLSTLQASTELLLEQSVAILFVFNDLMDNLTRHSVSLDGTPSSRLVHSLADQWIGSLSGVALRDIMIVAPGTASDAGFLIERSTNLLYGRELGTASIYEISDRLLSYFNAMQGGASQVRSAARPNVREQTQPVATLEEGSDKFSNDQALVVAAGYPLPPVNNELKITRLLVEAELLIRRQPNTALSLAERALILDPCSITALGLVALVHFTRGEPLGLNYIAERINDISPGHPWANVIHGAYYALRGDETRAKPHLREAEQSARLDDLIWIAAVWQRAGNSREAARVFTFVLQHHPQNVDAMVGLLSTDTLDKKSAVKLLRLIDSLDQFRPDTRSILVSHLAESATLSAKINR